MTYCTPGQRAARALAAAGMVVVLGAAVATAAPALEKAAPAPKAAAIERKENTGEWFIIRTESLPSPAQHTRHFGLFGQYASRYGAGVLKGIDKVQSSAMDGGGYFIGIHATPTESPVGYALKLLGNPLLTPPRTSSYCSGSSYSAFIEGLNVILKDTKHNLSPERLEAMRMQEPDGGRRDDGVKMWGWWNSDGFGSQFALVQYARMGEEIQPKDARPGDFMNICWKSGLGHSVVFLGWCEDAAGNKGVAFWSSQKSTNGFGDSVAPLANIRQVKIVRLTNPQALFTLDPAQKVNPKVPGDTINW